VDSVQTLNHPLNPVVPFDEFAGPKGVLFDYERKSDDPSGDPQSVRLLGRCFSFFFFLFFLLLTCYLAGGFLRLPGTGYVVASVVALLVVPVVGNEHRRKRTSPYSHKAQARIGSNMLTFTRRKGSPRKMP
jgi:hypothetical protein